jgi:hypothetical protein
MSEKETVSARGCPYCDAGHPVMRDRRGAVHIIRGAPPIGKPCGQGMCIADPSCQREREPIWALWFDADGNGPIPMGAANDIRAQPATSVDGPGVALRVQALGGLTMTAADAIRLSDELRVAAEYHKTCPHPSGKGHRHRGTCLDCGVQGLASEGTPARRALEGDE